MSKPIPLAAQAALSKFESAREILHSYAQQHARTIKDYDVLRQAHNEALANVKAIFKEHHESIGDRLGDFTARTNTEINVLLLVELLEDKADLVGHPTFKLDRTKYNEAVKSGLIPSSVVRQVESRSTPAIYGPKEA